MANPNPDTSGLIPYKKGETGNPQGKTSEQKKQEYRNAEKAVALRGRYLDALERQMDAAQKTGDDEAMVMAIAQMGQVTLKLLKDAEDRGLGAPVQPVTSPDGSMAPWGGFNVKRLEGE